MKRTAFRRLGTPNLLIPQRRVGFVHIHGSAAGCCDGNKTCQSFSSGRPSVGSPSSGQTMLNSVGAQRSRTSPATFHPRYRLLPTSSRTPSEVFAFLILTRSTTCQTSPRKVPMPHADLQRGMRLSVINRRAERFCPDT